MLLAAVPPRLLPPVALACGAPSRTSPQRPSATTLTPSGGQGWRHAQGGASLLLLLLVLLLLLLLLHLVSQRPLPHQLLHLLHMHPLPSHPLLPLHPLHSMATPASGPHPSPWALWGCAAHAPQGPPSQSVTMMMLLGGGYRQSMPSHSSPCPTWRGHPTCTPQPPTWPPLVMPSASCATQRMGQLMPMHHHLGGAAAVPSVVPSVHQLLRPLVALGGALPPPTPRPIRKAASQPMCGRVV